MQKQYHFKYLGWLRDNLTGVTQHLVEVDWRRRFVTEEEMIMLQLKYEQATNHRALRLK